jgi:hypothetical protein
MGLFTKRSPKFSAAGSKQQYLQEWVGGILEAAGAESARAREMVDMAADSIVRQTLRAVAESYHDRDALAFVDGLDRDSLAWRLDATYDAVLEIATADALALSCASALPRSIAGSTMPSRQLDRTMLSMRPSITANSTSTGTVAGPGNPRHWTPRRVSTSILKRQIPPGGRSIERPAPQQSHTPIGLAGET